MLVKNLHVAESANHWHLKLFYSRSDQIVLSTTEKYTCTYVQYVGHIDKFMVLELACTEGTNCFFKEIPDDVLLLVDNVGHPIPATDNYLILSIVLYVHVQDL